MLISPLNNNSDLLIALTALQNSQGKCKSHVCDNVKLDPPTTHTLPPTLRRRRASVHHVNCAPKACWFSSSELGVVAHTRDPNTEEAEAGGLLRVQASLGYSRKLYQKEKRAVPCAALFRFVPLPDLAVKLL